MCALTAYSMYVLANIAGNKTNWWIYHAHLFCPSFISQMGQSSLWWWSLVSQFCVTFAGVARTAKMSLWATGGGRTTTTCTGSTCPACTAAVAATAARPPSRLLPTPSVMHRSQSTCKCVTHRGWFSISTPYTVLKMHKCSCCCPAVMSMKPEALSASCSMWSQTGEGNLGLINSGMLETGLTLCFILTGLRTPTFRTLAVKTLHWLDVNLLPPP